jgi:hypothetical protein
MKVLFLVLTFTLSALAFGQTKDAKPVDKKIVDDKTPVATSGIELIKDPRVDGLVRKQAFPLSPDGIPQIPGYRVQLLFDSDKRKIDEMRARFINANPSIETYIVYNAPNYLLKAGDCRTYNDAEKIRDAVRRSFPGSFIVREMIKVPKLD